MLLPRASVVRHVLTLLLSAVLLGPDCAYAKSNSTPAAAPVQAGTQSLDGSWQIVSDAADAGRTQRWFEPDAFPHAEAKPIRVPGDIFQALPRYNGVVWYSREFTPTVPTGADEKSYLRFGAVQYSCEVWLNGTAIGAHEGGASPFEIDVTASLRAHATNRLTLRIFSPLSFFEHSGYPLAFDMGGITQHVTLASQPHVRIASVFARPSLQESNVAVQVELENNSGQAAEVALSAIIRERKSGKEVGRMATGLKLSPGISTHKLSSAVASPHPWNLDDPFLYTVEVAAKWQGRVDEYVVSRIGFRDFRINAAGFFELNGKRIFVKSTHHNVYDPVTLQGTAGDMTYLAQDAKQLKAAGFNMMRFICFTPLPEQLEIADELGLLIYSEHQSSWMLADPAKFAVDLPGVIKRDRNHPSLVIWGLLNEEARQEIYQVAHDFLPTLRKIDDSRLVLVSSGRWDANLKLASASNPGSPTWNVFLGGEDASSPKDTGTLSGIGVREKSGFAVGVGDAHMYQRYPQTGHFLLDLAKYAQNTRPVFISEAGNGSAYDPLNEKRKLQQVNAPASAYAYNAWIEGRIPALEAAWIRFGLKKTYPVIDDFFADSARVAAGQRAEYFSAVRSNPKINGHSTTSMMDAWGAGEGVMDTFREYKPGHLQMLQDGWAGLRWCLLINPTAVYADQPVHVRVALANEDILAAGKYAGQARITDAAGKEVWSQALALKIPDEANAPLAYTLFEADVALGNLSEGKYTLKATLESPVKAAASEISFTVFQSKNHATLNGLTITALNVPRPVLDLLTSRGATVRDYEESQSFDRETILVGEIKDGNAESWRKLYSRVARGAHAVFLSSKVFADKEGKNHWLPISPQGKQIPESSSGESELYHTDYVSQPHAIMTGLTTRVMAPRLYGSLLASPARFVDTAAPDETIAVGLRSTYKSSVESLTIGIFNHHQGKLTVNSFDLAGQVGNPAADRLIINLLNYARQTATPVGPLPPDYARELEQLGLKDSPTDTPKPNG